MHDWTPVTDAGPSDRRFLRPTWFHAWDSAYGDDRNWRRPVRYISVAEGADNACILPLGTQRIGPFAFASLCGSYFPSRGVPFRGDPARLAAASLPLLRDMGSSAGVRLGPVPEDDPLFRALAPVLERDGWSVTRRKVGTDFILDNPGGAEAYQKALSNNRRKKIDYYWRKLQEAGDTTLRHFTDAGADWTAVIRDIQTVEVAAWVARDGEPRFLGSRNACYWARLTADPWFGRALNVWIIYHCDAPVSFALALDSGDTRYVIANSFDERVAQYRTGTKIYQQLILDAFERGLTRINIGMGDTGYKSGWGARPGPDLADMVAFAPTLYGTTARLAARMQEVLQRFGKS